MINSFNGLRSHSTFLAKTYYPKKGSRFLIAAFLLLISTFPVLSGCESSGTVGNDIISGNETIGSETVYIDNFSIVEENAFSGRLTYTSVGYFEDPAYGTIKSIALLKPSISTSEVDTLEGDETISLRLIFDGTVYGDSVAVSSYEIYEAGEIWRGTELRYNNEVSVDMTGKVGEFQLSALEDTVVVELDDAWTNKFGNFFNADTSLTSAERDSAYINNFPGIAIVPSESNKNIRFLKNATTDEDQEDLITGFLVESPDQEEDEEPEELSVRDWGASFIRQNEPQTEGEGNFILHNNERLLKFQLDLPYEKLSDKNIVSARLVLSKTNPPVQTQPEVIRPVNDQVRIHVFDEEPYDVMAEIFTNQPLFSNSLDDTTDAFIVDVTGLVLNEVFGEERDRFLYLTIQSINGFIYSSHFFDQTASDARKPRLIITFAE